MEHVKRKLEHEVKKSHQNYDAYCKVESIYAPLFEHIPEDAAERSFFSDDCLYLSFTGNGELLSKVVRSLRVRGWETKDRVMPGATEAHLNFHKDGLSVYVTFTSNVCKMVQVGTRMQEVAIYEIHCEDGTVKEVAPE